LCVLAYCIGSVSSAIIVCRLSGLPDPRTTGSKNPGTTNVLRLGGKLPAAITLLGDVLKGVIAVALAVVYNPLPQNVGPVILAVFLGHLYPIFFGFRGGKGVATAMGAVFVLSWPVGLMLVGTWIIMVLLFQISSLGALTAAFVAPLYIYLFGWKGPEFSIYVGVMSVLIFWCHRANIGRLLQGKEPKVNIFSKIRS